MTNSRIPIPSAPYGNAWALTETHKQIEIRINIDWGMRRLGDNSSNISRGSPHRNGIAFQ